MSSEIEAIQTFDTVLSGLDELTRVRVLNWAWQKYGSPSGSPERIQEKAYALHNQKRGTAVNVNSTNRKGTPKSRPSIIKDLNLRPNGKKDFPSFVAEKQPTDNYEKCTVAVYYLNQELGLESVSVDHVFTCYKAVGWRLPASLQNALALTSHRKGWLDTSDFKNIKLTTHGENFVEHDLPHKGANA